MRAMQRMGALTLTAVLGLGLAACGGSDDDASDTTGSTTTEADGGSSETSGADVGDFTGECADFAQAFAGAGAAVGSAFTGGDGSDIEAAADYFQGVADKLPEEIRDDFQTFADAYAEFAKGVADADIDFSDPSAADPEKLAALSSLSEAFNSDEVQQASDNIQAYVENSCQGG